MPKDPFGLFEELDEADFENNPVAQATKKASDTALGQVKTQTQTTAKTAADQVTPDASLMNALYGSSEPNSEEKGENASGQNPGQQAAHDSSTSAPDEATKLNHTRALLKAHMENYGNQFQLENEMNKVRRQKEQSEQLNLQQEAEASEKKNQQQVAKSQELPMPQGKKQGVPDFVLKREQNKAEQNRGTSG